MPPHRPPVTILIGGPKTLFLKSLTKWNPCTFGSKPVIFAVPVGAVSGGTGVAGAVLGEGLGSRGGLMVSGRSFLGLIGPACGAASRSTAGRVARGRSAASFRTTVKVVVPSFA